MKSNNSIYMNFIQRVIAFCKMYTEYVISYIRRNELVLPQVESLSQDCSSELWENLDNSNYVNVDIYKLLQPLLWCLKKKSRFDL